MRTLGRALGWLFTVTLLRVKFGLVLLGLLAAYIAVGSGVPEVREYFEMDEMAFFNAWPMRVLALLLVLNVVFVTFDRIPFTLPRLGVWMVHAGIVVLVIGMTNYFAAKVEGLTLIPVGRSVNHFYDGHTRALYARVGRREAEPMQLDGLPRFATYTDLDVDVPTPMIREYDPELRAAARRPLGVEARVTAYWPYARIEAVADLVGEAGSTAIRLGHAAHEGHSDDEEHEDQWLFAGKPAIDSLVTDRLELRHLHREDLTAEQLEQAAGEVHRFKITTPDGEHEGTLVPGQEIEVGGYMVAFQNAVPSWRTIDGRLRDAAVLHVCTPDDVHFNRMILDGEAVQTDFVDTPGSGPMGERQDEPVDPGLVVMYKFADTLQLTPRTAEVRHTLLTRPGEGSVHLLTTRHDLPPVVGEFGGEGEPLVLGPFEVERVDGVEWSERVVEVPPSQRDKDDGRAGVFQVLEVELATGDWSQRALVPFMQWPHLQPWSGPVVDVPGLDEPVRLQFGNLARPMPWRVQVDGFEATPYAGAEASRSALMRDFRSDLTLINESTGEQWQDSAKLNEPVFARADRPLWFDESWLFYQASWDPDNQAFTVLGVGNRPGVRTMTTGCVLVGVGLLWAFYVKPVILRRRKAEALRKHREQQATPGVEVGTAAAVPA